MAETTSEVLRRCNKEAHAFEKAATNASARLANAEKEHRAHGEQACSAACNSELESARAEDQQAQNALQDALARKENAELDVHEEAGNDDPIEPPASYELKDILAKLSHYHQRATYNAVGGLFNNSPWYFVFGWLSDRKGRHNSFVVSEVTGEPKDYPADCVHPNIKLHREILRDSKELLAWLQTHRIVPR